MKATLPLFICLFCTHISFSQCDGFEKFEQGIEEAKITHVRYVDYMKQNPPNYKAAFPLWKQLYEQAPAGHVRHFTDGVKLYKQLIKEENDPQKKEALTQDLWEIYDHRIQCFGKEGYVLGRKAYNMYFLGVDEEETLNTFARSIELEGNESAYYVIATYAKVYVNQFIKDKNISTDAMKVYNEMRKKLQEIAEYNINNAEDSARKTKYEEALETINQQFNKVVIDPYDCEVYKMAFAQEFDETRFKESNLRNLTKEDRQIWMMTYRKLEAGGCSKTDPLLQKIEKFDQLYRNFCGVSTIQRGNIAIKEKRYDEAIRLYKQAITETNDVEQKAKLHLRIAKILGIKKQRNEARKEALQAAVLMPKNGEPYIFIGEMYVSSLLVCGSGKDWDSLTIIWAAIDKWQYAKSIDLEVADEANRLISMYSKYLPSNEEVHQRNLEKGQSYKVKCWIQETTTVRSRKQY